MPFYDFKCPNDHKFELKQSFLDEPVATCPTCDAQARRLISLVPVHYKGSGFYVNDYGPKKTEPSSSPSSNGESKSDSTSSDSSKSSAESSEEPAATGAS